MNTVALTRDTLLREETGLNTHTPPSSPHPLPSLTAEPGCTLTAASEGRGAVSLPPCQEACSESAVDKRARVKEMQVGI